MKPLKRHPALIELSREHHGSLPLYVRLLHTPGQSHRAKLEPHFIEPEPHLLEGETMFAPYWDKIDLALWQRFEDDRAELHTMMVHPEYTNESWNREFAVALRGHARFEERELFPAIEPFLSLPEDM